MAVAATVNRQRQNRYDDSGLAATFASFSHSVMGKLSTPFRSSSSCHTGHEESNFTTSASAALSSTSNATAVRVSKAYFDHEIHQFTKGEYKPWEDEDGNVIWSPLRTVAAKLVLDRRFDFLMICVILFNLGVIIVESDRVAKCYPDYKDNIASCPDSADNIPFLRISNLSLLVCYTIEATVKIAVLHREFFRSKENVLDFFIVISALLAEVVGNLMNLSWLRILRVARLFRTVQIVTKVPELYMLITGFKGSMKAMFFGAGLLLGLLGFFSILLVQLIHPINVELVYGDCDDCHLSYSTVILSTLTLFQQIVAGDSWGKTSVPVLKRSPWWGLLLPFVQIVVGVGAMNLILAVVVDRAQEARDNNKDKIIQDKIREAHARRKELLRLFKELDADQSGNLQLEEVRHAYRSSQEFQKLLMLSDISEDELCEVFKFCDTQGTGDVSYHRLCKALDEIQAGDMQKTCMLNKMYIQMMAERMNQQDLILRLHRDLLERIDNKLLAGDIYPAMNSSLSSRPKSQDKKSDRPSVTKSDRPSVTFSEFAPDQRSSDKLPEVFIKDVVVNGEDMNLEMPLKSAVAENDTAQDEKWEGSNLTKDRSSPSNPCLVSSSNGSDIHKTSSNGTVGSGASNFREEFKQLRSDLTELESQADRLWQDSKTRGSSLRSQINNLEAMLDFTERTRPGSMQLSVGTLEEHAFSQFHTSLACLQSSFFQARHLALVDIERSLIREDVLMSSHRRFACRTLQDVGASLTSSALSGRVRI